MKKVFLLAILLMVCSPSNVMSQKRLTKKADAQTEVFRYDIQAEGVGVQGTYLVKVWSYSKKSTIAAEQAMKNAVHGILYKGFAGRSGVSGKAALLNSAQEKEAFEAYSDEFFGPSGQYRLFAEQATDGQISADDFLKVGKEYKVGLIISVKVDALRKDLEQRGIIKGLASGF
ncbi:MAG: hypothetical protein RR931_07770 [Mucinivorans sp.]